MIVMSFYAWKQPSDGNIHVQNAVGGMLGQHHVHTPEDFKRWSEGMTIDWLEGITKDCDCGLKPGEKEDGRKVQLG